MDASGRVSGAGFLPRKQDQGRVSVQWVECGDMAPLEKQIDSVRTRLSKRVQGYSTDGRIAILSVRVVRSIEEQNQTLDVLHWPTKSNHCHSVITGVEGLLALPLAEMLAELANGNTVAA
jgi:hypothetical protein